MNRPTKLQLDVITELEEQYGRADLASIERDNPQRRVRLIWYDQRRILDINDTGGRVIYDHRHEGVWP